MIVVEITIAHAILSWVECQSGASREKIGLISMENMRGSFSDLRLTFKEV
jgi:hypothetical protein